MNIIINNYSSFERSISNIFIIWIMNAISFMGVFFIGITESSEVLISCGLGAATVNIIFEAVDWGLMSGLDTLVSQAYGRKDIDSWEAYLNIWRYFVLLLTIPQAIIVHFSDVILPIMQFIILYDCLAL